METFYKKLGLIHGNVSSVMEKGLDLMDKKGVPFVLATYNKSSRHVIMVGFNYKADVLDYLETLGYKGKKLTRSFRAASNSVIQNNVYVDHHVIGMDF